ncbi:hypothetical protein QE152_g35943 [Popillia japonica]|uniref:Uncharacterized protein n=1 Tax=Popillia japonica TaxID=7064 RepID=A0AAW1IEQ3_POPJA
MHVAWKKAQTGRGSLLPAAKRKKLYWCKKRVPAESQATQQSTIFGVTNPSPKWDEDQKNKKNGQLKRVYYYKIRDTKRVKDFGNWER